MATASDITKRLISFIEDVAGSDLKASQKAKLDVIASIIGTLGDDLTPILESRFDIEGVFAGVQDVESGAAQMDNGVKTILAALKTKPHSTPALPNLIQ